VYLDTALPNINIAKLSNAMNGTWAFGFNQHILAPTTFSVNNPKQVHCDYNSSFLDSYLVISTINSLPVFEHWNI
jgi:hypothetical protein